MGNAIPNQDISHTEGPGGAQSAVFDIKGSWVIDLANPGILRLPDGTIARTEKIVTPNAEVGGVSGTLSTFHFERLPPHARIGTLRTHDTEMFFADAPLTEAAVSAINNTRVRGEPPQSYGETQGSNGDAYHLLFSFPDGSTVVQLYLFPPPSSPILAPLEESNSDIEEVADVDVGPSGSSQSSTAARSSGSSQSSPTARPSGSSQDSPTAEVSSSADAQGSLNEESAPSRSRTLIVSAGILVGAVAIAGLLVAKSRRT